MLFFVIISDFCALIMRFFVTSYFNNRVIGKVPDTILVIRAEVKVEALGPVRGYYSDERLVKCLSLIHI